MIRKIYKRYIESYQGLSREVWLLALLMFINRSGAMVIPFLSVYLTQKLDFSLEQTGWVMASFGLGSLVGVYIGGYLTDRIGYYKVQLWSLLLTGVMFFILQKMDSFIMFNIMIFSTSVLADAFRPANMTAVAFYSKAEDQTRSISLIRLAINAGWGIGPAIGGVIAIQLGYHWLFWLDGLTCILAGFFLLLFLKENSKPTISEEVAEKESEDAKVNILKDHFFMIFLGLNVLIMLVFFQLFTSIPVYLKSELLLNEDSIGLIMALNGLIIAAVEMPIVYLLENKYSSLRIIIIGTLLITISYTVYLLGSWQGLAVISMILVTFGEIFHMPFANAFTMGRANRSQMGKYMSYYGMSFSLAFIFAPIVGMQIADRWGYSSLWTVMSIIGIVASIGYYILYKRSKTRDLTQFRK